MIVRPPPTRWSASSYELDLEHHGDFTVFYEIFVEGAYDPLLQYIRAGDCVIDAGANIGLFSLLAAARVGHQGIVLAVEPNPVNFGSLENHIVKNGIRNIRAFPYALSDVDGGEVWMGGQGIRAHILNEGESALQSEGRYRVPTITLDELLRREDLAPRILKMDIEGAERLALTKARQMLEGVEAVAIEVHDPAGRTVVEESFRDFGLTPFPSRGVGPYLRAMARHPYLMAKLELANHLMSLRRLLRDFGEVPVGDGGYPVMYLGHRRIPLTKRD